MPLDCSQCDIFNTPLVITKPCGLVVNVYKDPLLFPQGGEKQIPLLHLMYIVVTEAYKPEARQVRASWREPKFGKQGQKLAYPLYEIKQKGAEEEVQDMVGMILGQMPHVLPIWAQVGRDAQMQIATDLCAMLKGERPQSDWLAKMQFQILQGRGHGDLKAQKLAATQALEKNRLKIAEMQKYLDQVQGPSSKARERISTLETEVQDRTEAIDAISNIQQKIRDRQFEIEQTIGPVFEMGQIETGEKRRSIIELMWTGEDEARAVQLANEYDALTIEHSNWSEKKKKPQEVIDDCNREIVQLAQLVNSVEKAGVEIEKAMLRDLALQRELDGSREAYDITRFYGQSTLQQQCLQNDYALFPGNYEDPQDQKELYTVLDSGPIARAMFLLMDPRLKYANDKKSVCRIRKFLASPEVQESFKELDAASLIQPGPYAKLGIFVMNALKPGSYDDRHRTMVQKELEQITTGMLEFGMDPTIVCHSCGADEPSGDPTLAKDAWIRDHNPPTAFFELGPKIYRDKLNLRDWSGNGVANGQILLPQCRECSKRQGALMGKVTLILKEIPALDLYNTKFDLPAYLKSQLDSDEDWNDFVRLVCQPTQGWRAPSDLSAEVSLFNWTRLVTTGKAGSFVGIDEDILKNMGKTLGCHTCTDVPRQLDPYRNIYWIADHQPPTALVARGLRELPQIVYPQCWNCSSEQSQRVNRMARLFDGCFGKDFKKSWTEGIKIQKFGDIQ